MKIFTVTVVVCIVALATGTEHQENKKSLLNLLGSGGGGMDNIMNTAIRKIEPIVNAKMKGIQNQLNRIEKMLIKLTKQKSKPADRDVKPTEDRNPAPEANKNRSPGAKPPASGTHKSSKKT